MVCERQALWIAAPQLAYAVTHQQLLYVDSTRSAARRFLKSHIPLKRIIFHYATDREGSLGVWATQNQGRNLTPLLDGHPKQHVHIFRQQRVSDTLISQAEHLASQFLDIPPDRGAVVDLLQFATEAVQIALRLLNDYRPKKLLIATQHNFLARALSVAARQLRIPSIYIPHAPTANNLQYRDIPFNLALLRGVSDCNAYLEWGARRERLDVIGDVSWQLKSIGRGKQHPKSIVIAPSPWSGPRLEWFFSSVNIAVNYEHEVLPHPSNGLSEIRRLASKKAHVITGVRTVDYLSDEPRIVIAGGSGVTLEALALGHSVVNLVPSDSPVNYLFQQSSLMNFVFDAQGLADAIRTQQDRWLPDSTALRYADQWLAATGRQAVANGREAIESEIDTTEWALDAWKEVVL